MNYDNREIIGITPLSEEAQKAAAAAMDINVWSTLNFWISEREEIRLRKENGSPRPWTNDKKLATKSYCNVRRFHDRGTRWCIERICRNENLSDREKLLWLVSYRIINSPETFEAIKFDTEDYDLSLMSDSPFRTAYMHAGTCITFRKWLETNRNETFPKGNGRGEALVVFHYVGVWSSKLLEILDANSPLEVHSILLSVPGLGKFLTHQITEDIQYMDFCKWKDLYQTAIVGPGSIRGLKRLFPGLKIGDKNSGGVLLYVWGLVIRFCEGLLPDGFTIGDLQNCFCELDKYSRESGGSRVYKPRS